MHSSFSLNYNHLPILNEDEGNKNFTIESDKNYKGLSFTVKSQEDYRPSKNEISHFSDKELLESEINKISNKIPSYSLYRQHFKNNLEDMNTLPNTVLSEFLKKYNQERIHHLKQKNEDDMETSSDSDEDLYMHKVLAPLRKSKTTPGLYNSSQIRENNTKEKKSFLLPLLKSQTTFNFMEIQKNKIIKNDIISNENCDSKNKISLIEKSENDNVDENPTLFLKSYCNDKISNSNSESCLSNNINEKVEILQKDIYMIEEEEVCKWKRGDKIIENENCYKKCNEVDEIVDNKNICKNKCYLESNSTLNNMNLLRVWSVPANIDYFGEVYSYQNTVSVMSSGWSAPELEGKNISYTSNSSVSSISSSVYDNDNFSSKQSILDKTLNMTNLSLNSYKYFDDDDEDDDLQLTKFGDTKYFRNLRQNISFVKNKIPNSISDSHLVNVYENNFKTTLFDEKNDEDIKFIEDNKIGSDKTYFSHLPTSFSMIGNFEKRLNILSKVDEKMPWCQKNHEEIGNFNKKDNSSWNIKICKEKDIKTNDKNLYDVNKTKNNEMSYFIDKQVKNENVKNFDDQMYQKDSINGYCHNLLSNGRQDKGNASSNIDEEPQSHIHDRNALKNSNNVPCNTDNGSQVLQQNIASSHNSNSSSINSIATSMRHDNINNFLSYTNDCTNIPFNGAINKNIQNREKLIIPHSLSFFCKNTIPSNSTVNTPITTPINSTSSMNGVRKRILPKRPDFIEYVSMTPEQNEHHAATTSCAMSNYRIEDDLMYKRDFVQYNSGPNVNHQNGENIYHNVQMNNNRFGNSMSQQYLNSNLKQDIAGSSQILKTNINTGVSRSHRKLPPLPIKAEVAALIEGITKPLPPSISSLMNPSNHIPQQGHSSINSVNTPGSLDYDVHIEPQMQHSPCYPYVKANTINGRNSGDHQLCYGIESTIIRSTCTIEDSYYEDGLNGNAQGSVKQVIHTNTDDSSGVSSCCTNIDNLNPTHRVQNIFIPRHDDEILLEIGDAIHVEREYDDHWCFGTNLRTGKHGIFPSAHICEIDLVEEICMGALNNNSSKPLHEDRDTFYLTMLASIEVAHHKGNDVLVQAINKVMSCYQNKEEILVPQTVLMEVSLRGIHVIDKKKKNFFRCPTFDFFFSLQNISFCGAHPKHLKYFGFITKHPLLPRFACHVFLSNESTQPIVEAIGRAFKRSYDEYMAFAHPTEDIYIE